MAFTAGELANISNAALDYYLNKGKSFKQTIQERPLLSAMESGSKTFPGGKGDISLAVKGDYGAGGTNDSVVGYTHNDTVAFYNPANLKRAAYTWREHHIGISLTHTELKHDGISVVDTAIPNADRVSRHSDREMTVLVGLLEDKLEDLGEKYARDMNNLLWGDGTGDAKALAGIRALIAANPEAGTVGGLDRSTTTWWRNRARTAAYQTAITGGATGSSGGDAVTSSASGGGALLQVLQAEYRQLRRYGGRPTKFLAGSDFIDAMETEIRANGNYSDTGFQRKAATDGGMAELSFKGVPVIYDPTLDDLSLAKRAYWFDPRHIYLMAMEDEWRKTHSPARPADQFVLYRSITSTGQMVADQMNCHLVIDIK